MGPFFCQQTLFINKVGFCDDMLQTYDNLVVADIRDLGFQQDGALPHWSRQVRAYLDATFGGVLIACGCPTAWPARSPDLTLMDFFF